MPDKSDIAYNSATYGARDIGFGVKPGIVVVDFQKGFVDPSYKLGGAALVERAVGNSADLLEVARRHAVPVVNCYTAYSSSSEMPHWKVEEIKEIMLHGHPATELDDRIYDANHDLKVFKSGASAFWAIPMLQNNNSEKNTVKKGVVGFIIE